jgi:hypothetical protein
LAILFRYIVLSLSFLSLLITGVTVNVYRIRIEVLRCYFLLVNVGTISVIRCLIRVIEFYHFHRVAVGRGKIQIIGFALLSVLIRRTSREKNRSAESES